jgi:hypothetical protein
MECVSCHFENMPGTDLCGRCGSSMRLATTLIDVHPRRASGLRKRIRRVAPVRVAINAMFRGFEQLRPPTSWMETLQNVHSMWPVLIRVPIPGWPQFYVKHRVRGYLFLYSWLFFVLLGLLFFGTTKGSMLLGLAFSVHSSSAMDVIAPYLDNPTLAKRMSWSIAVSILLAVAMYWPASRMLNRWADPITLQAPAGPFAEGDVLLANHAIAQYRPGQLVLFDIDTDAFPQRLRNHQYVYYQNNGVDRILAGPGDSFRWEHGHLFINGQQTSLKPLDPQRLPSYLSATVPRDCYLIFPTSTNNLGPNSPVGIWLQLSLINKEDLHGIVYMQTHPLSQMQVLH